MRLLECVIYCCLCVAGDFRREVEVRERIDYTLGINARCIVQAYEIRFSRCVHYLLGNGCCSITLRIQD